LTAVTLWIYVVTLWIYVDSRDKKKDLLLARKHVDPKCISTNPNSNSSPDPKAQ